MNTKSPYLDAIQRIPGKTAKEKYESLNKIIKKLIENKETSGDFEFQTIYGSPFPLVFRPLIETEIAKILKKPEDVITALKSDDAIVVNRALQSDWIFDGSIKSITNFHFFSIHIFPEISLNTRTSVIKRLSQHLGHKKEYTIALEFFEGISNIYNSKQALPLLSACSETYLSEIIKNKNVILPKKLVTRLFSKYPELIIKYFKFGSPAPSKERSVNVANINDYSDTLPKLVKKYVNDFVDIVNSYDYPLSINLGKKCAEFFLESRGIEALVNAPKKFLPLLSMKLVTKKLNKEQFELMFRNLFPDKHEYFSFDNMLTFLEFQPEKMKLPLILNTFKNVYGIDLLSLLHKVTTKMLLMLPNEERVKIARKKLETEPEEIYPSEESWICYLLTSESIPKIKDEISKTKKADDRIPLIGQLIYTCKVNKSEDDLHEVLQYISTKHRNEISFFWLRVYDTLMKYFSLELLSEKHWAIINEMIQRSYVKNYFLQSIDVSERLLEKAVHYNLLNSIPIEDRMVMLAELKIQGWNSKFNILCDYPNYEKLCLETFIDIIPRKFPEDHSVWNDNELDTIQHLTNDIYDFNDRMKNAAKKKQKNLKSEDELSILNYPWLLEKVKTLVQDENNRYQYKIDSIKELLFTHERKLYDSLFPFTDKIAKVDDQEGLNLLKKEPSKILEHWKEYFESCEKNLNSVHTRKFLKKSTWYSEIPIKFLEEAVTKLHEGCNEVIMILALLLHGSEFAEIIKPLVPNSERMEIDGDDAKNLYNQAYSIPPAINEANPPPPLELVSKFCQGDYLQLGLTSLMNVARRVPVNRVIVFAKNLVEKPVSVKKHGIRLLYVVSPSSDLYNFLRHMWNTEKHKSIREVVFQKSFEIFCNQPSKDTWNLIKCMIEGLTVEDRESFKLLVMLKKIPNEYIKDYFETALKKVDNLEKEGLRQKHMINVIVTLLSSLNIEICVFFPEEFSQLLLQQFTFDLDKNNEILNEGYNYAIDIFLMGAENKLDSRLNYFCDLLKSVIKEKWDQSHPDNFRFYPMKQLFRKIVSGFSYNKITDIDIKILKSMVDLFSSVLRPVQDSQSYLSLYFTIKFKEAEFNGKIFGSIIGNQLPQIVKIFSSEMIIDIAEILANFLSPLDNNLSKEGTIIGSFTQSLVDTNSTYSSIVAAIVLYKNHSAIPDDLYKDILQKLRKVNHPVVEALLNKHINSVLLDQVYK